jgi:hypothetical protein
MRATIIPHRYGEANPDRPFAMSFVVEPQRDDVIEHADGAGVAWLSLTVEQRRHTSEGLVLVCRGVVAP